ncbi:Ureohydrolase domain [Phytophthora cactorum]|nr:Ureohydrolase domain [Phytophthora cactorum]
MLRRASSSLLRRVQQRGISSSSCRQWDQVRPHFHAGDHRNPLLSLPQTVSVIGAPMTYGQPLLGTDGGPDLLHAVDLGWSVEENGNLNFVAPSSNDPMLDPRFGKAKQCFPVGNGTKQLYEIFKQKAGEGKFCLVLGGDHTIGAGSLAGLLSVHPDAGVIWVDAHADINTPADSDSGNMHGMPISFLMEGMVDSSKVPGFEWLANGPTMKPEQLVYVGLRDVDTFERRVIHEKGIKAFSMQEVDRYGIGKTMEMALDHLLDPLVAPSTGTRVRGGLTWRRLTTLPKLWQKQLDGGSGHGRGEPDVAPGDGAQITVDMALMLISSALGNRIL